MAKVKSDQYVYFQQLAGVRYPAPEIPMNSARIPYFGSKIDPINKIVPVLSSLITQVNGRSTIMLNTFIDRRKESATISTAVAAAASVPSSLTSTKVLCMTL